MMVLLISFHAEPQLLFYAAGGATIALIIFCAKHGGDWMTTRFHVYYMFPVTLLTRGTTPNGLCKDKKIQKKLVRAHKFTIQTFLEAHH